MARVVMTNSLWVYLIVSTVIFTSALLYSSLIPGEFIYNLYSGKWRALAVLNFVCCCVGLSGHFVYKKIYETLRAVEQQNLRDLFWNLAFYKFIFMFGVMNMREISEMIGWCVWFSIIGMLMLVCQLCRDRFEYMSFSPHTAMYSYAKIISLLLFVILTCSALYMICAIVGWQYGIGYFLFIIAEVFIVMIKAIHTLICCIIHLWDLHHDGMWENHSIYSHYTDFLLEMIALSVDLMHHLHMILWNNFVPSLAGVVLLLQMKFIYGKIQAKLRKHHDYVAVTETLETRFPAATKEELSNHSQLQCAICRDKMLSARKLPCTHLFHLGCLRSWLYHDNSCPLCRSPIPLTNTHISSSHDSPEVSTNTASGGLRAVGMTTMRHAPFQLRNRRNLASNQVFHFHGPTLASWLPSVSVELPSNQTNSPGLGRNVVHEMYDCALQLHAVFPNVPLHLILIDLTRTYSVDVTIQNILNGNIIPVQSTATTTQQQQQMRSTPTEPLPDMECSSDNDRPVMNDDDNTAAADSDIVTPQHKLSDKNLGDIIVNNKMTDLSFPPSRSFQERKALFIEQARRKYLQKHST